MMRKYLDSNVFIYPLLYEDEESPFYEKILLDLVEKKFQGFTSVLTWDELVHVLRKKKGEEIAAIEGQKFLNFPELVFVNANLSVLRASQKIIETYGLKPRDAIHAASALSNNCDEIISDDDDFDGIKEIKRKSVKLNSISK